MLKLVESPANGGLLSSVPVQVVLLGFLVMGKSLNGVAKAAIFLGGIAFCIGSELKVLRFVIRRRLPAGAVAAASSPLPLQ